MNEYGSVALDENCIIASGIILNEIDENEDEDLTIKRKKDAL